MGTRLATKAFDSDCRTVLHYGIKARSSRRMQNAFRHFHGCETRRCYEARQVRAFQGVRVSKCDKRHHAKIDIFKHVGTSAILVAPEDGNRVSEVSITSCDPLAEGL